MKYLNKKEFSIKHKQIHHQQQHLGNGFMDLKPVEEQLINNPIGYPDVDVLKGTKVKPKPQEIINFNRTFDNDDLGNLKRNPVIKIDKTINKQGQGFRKNPKKYNNLKFEL